MKPIVSAIVAQSENRAIGRDNKLLWHISEDLKYFRRMTTGKPVIMGRKTYESIGKPLPNRLNIVVSRNGFKADGVESAASVAEAIEIAKKSNPPEIMIIGGAQIYEQAMNLCDRLYVTQVHANIEGDAFFPQIDQKIWRETSAEQHEGDPAYTFKIFDHS